MLGRLFGKRNRDPKVQQWSFSLTQWHSLTTSRFLNSVWSALPSCAKSRQSVWYHGSLAAALEISRTLGARKEKRKEELWKQADPGNTVNAMFAYLGYIAAHALWVPRGEPAQDNAAVVRRGFRNVLSEYRTMLGFGPRENWLSDLFEVQARRLASIERGGHFFPSAVTPALIFAASSGIYPNLTQALVGSESTGVLSEGDILEIPPRPLTLDETLHFYANAMNALGRAEQSFAGLSSDERSLALDELLGGVLGSRRRAGVGPMIATMLLANTVAAAEATLKD